MSKELFTVTVSIDVDLIVEADGLERAKAIAERQWVDNLEIVDVTARARPFSDLDIEDSEYGWDEDCTPLCSNRTLREILKRRR
jgi:hypothetical protein